MIDRVGLLLFLLMLVISLCGSEYRWRECDAEVLQCMRVEFDGKCLIYSYACMETLMPLGMLLTNLQMLTSLSIVHCCSTNKLGQAFRIIISVVSLRRLF